MEANSLPLIEEGVTIEPAVSELIAPIRFLALSCAKNAIFIIASLL